jgi:hypothetical protein
VLRHGVLGTFAEGASVTLNAIASFGSRFVGWLGSGCSGAGACTTTLASDQTVTAIFAALPPPNTSITKSAITSNSRGGTATFRFSGRGIATQFQCALITRHHRSPSFKRCRSPQTYKRLTPGAYKFEVRAVGPGGTDPTAAKQSFTIAR